MKMRENEIEVKIGQEKDERWRRSVVVTDKTNRGPNQSDSETKKGRRLRDPSRSNFQTKPDKSDQVKLKLQNTQTTTYPIILTHTHACTYIGTYTHCTAHRKYQKRPQHTNKWINTIHMYKNLGHKFGPKIDKSTKLSVQIYQKMKQFCTYIEEPQRLTKALSFLYKYTHSKAILIDRRNEWETRIQLY